MSDRNAAGAILLKGEFVLRRPRGAQAYAAESMVSGDRSGVPALTQKGMTIKDA